MSVSATIFEGIYITSMISGGYFGFRYGPKLLQYVNSHVKAKAVKLKVLEVLDNPQVDEKDLFKGIGLVCGLGIGRLLWPIALPMAGVQVYNLYSNHW